MKDKFTFYPDRTTILTESQIPGIASEIWISTSDGESIQSFLFREESDTPRSLVIYFHGNAGNLYYRFDAAIRLTELYQDVLLVSYRGYAKSTGSPSEEGIYIDGRSSIHYAINTLGYRERDITILGRSLGSAVAVQVAQHKQFKGIILVTHFTSGKDMASAMGLGLFKFLAGNSYNTLERINNLQCPLLIIHGDEDEVVPYQMGKTLFQTYQGKKKMVTIRNGRHNNLIDVDSELYWDAINEFLSETN